jgi:hypothetical protein
VCTYLKYKSTRWSAVLRGGRTSASTSLTGIRAEWERLGRAWEEGVAIDSVGETCAEVEMASLIPSMNDMVDEPPIINSMNYQTIPKNPGL